MTATRTRHRFGAVSAAVLLALATGPLSAPAAMANQSGIIETTGSLKSSLMAAMDISGKPACVSIALSRTNRKWAIVSATNKCGPNSGHTQVYKKTASGWKYLFYDMENDGCSRFHMPKAVERDFTPWVC